MRSIIEGVASGAISKEEGLRQIAAYKQKHKQDLLYFTQTLREEPLPTVRANDLGHVLVLAADKRLQPLVSDALDSRPSSFTFVTPEELGAGVDGGHSSIGLEQAFAQLLAEMEKRGQFPGSILHMHSQEAMDERGHGSAMESGFYSVFALTKAIFSFKKRAKVSLLFHYRESEDSAVHAAVAAFGKSAMIENPDLLFKTVSTDFGREAFNADSLQMLLLELGHMQRGHRVVHYRNSRRLVPQLEGQEAPASIVQASTSEAPAYLITGGLGALGYMLASHLAETQQAGLVLVGRTPLNEAAEKKLEVLRRAGSKVTYVSCDIANLMEMRQLSATVKAHFPRLHGVLHCAGKTEDSFILRKSWDSMADVLAPKVAGTINLYEIFRNEPLEFMMLFSSISSVIGNIGQSDYAYANSFMDCFADEKRGFAGFRLISVNWPLWEAGGMGTTADSLEILRKNLGISPLPTSQGVRAMSGLSRSWNANALVLYGDGAKMEEAVHQMNHPANIGVLEEAATKPQLHPQLDATELKQGAEQYLKQIFIKVTKIPPHALGLDDSFEKIGFDSIMAMSINEELEAVFGDLSKTLLFEYQTLRELGEYFAEHHAGVLGKLIVPPASKKPAASVAVGIGQSPELRTAKLQAPRKVMPSPASPSKTESGQRTREMQDIAIIGLSGKFPMSPDMRAFWDNLLHARDCISEIPGDRWSIDEFYTTDKNELGKMYCKWGGFLDDVDRFDALFFNISPREAEIMDPQERLFLECAYSAIEDAGYTRDSLGSHKVGVFAGVMYGQYQLLDAEVDGRKIALSSVYASIANRVSYHLNLNGPSIALDTMCSSSLTSIHLACDSIRKGESDLAIAGGVNVSIHPDKYIFLSQQKFAASDGRCRSFGEGGDGYVPGEGVGTVLLKPLDRAISDGDHIYAVIKASSINHGGKTTGYTVPNPSMQGAVIQETLQAAGVNPRTINYIEAHGTGTSLGDPIEISGLVKAFKEGTGDKQFCAIGSVKSNIGHCESAAGIAAISKVLLQMKYGILVPSLHSEELNSHIHFEETPFYVQREVSAWDRVSLGEGTGRKEYPRRAGISSFGAGGANAHIILEEYIPAQSGAGDSAEEDVEHIIVLSARSEERLKAYAGKLVEYALEAEKEGILLADIAYTLQVGREPFSERVALIAGSTAELKELLNAYLEGELNHGKLFRGNAKGFKEYAELLSNIQPGVSLTDMLLESGNIGKIAQLWTLGLEVDWARLHRSGDRSRIPLPTYPYARNRYWVNEVKRREISYPAIIHETAGLGRLVERNLTTIAGFRFNSRAEIITRQYGLLSFGGQPCLNPFGMLSFAREALELAGYDGESIIENVVWSGMAAHRDGLMLDVYIYPEDGGALCEIRDEEERVLLQCKFSSRIHAEEDNRKSDLSLLEAKKLKDGLGEQIRQDLQSLYGITGVLEGARVGRSDGSDLLAVIDCGEQMTDSLAPEVLKQASELLLVLAAQSNAGSQVMLQAVANWTYRHGLARQFILRVERIAEDQYVLTTANGEGDILWSMRASASAGFPAHHPQVEAQESIGAATMLYYTTEWAPSGVEDLSGDSLGGDVVLFLDDASKLASFKLSFGSRARLIFVTPGEQYAQSGNSHYIVNYADKGYLAMLLKALGERGISITQMVFFAVASELPAEAKLSHSLHPLLFLIQALMESKAADKVRLVYAFTDTGSETALLDKALGGFVKTLRLESPNYSFKTVALETSVKMEDVQGMLEQELRLSNEEQEVRYSGTARFVKRLVPAQSQVDLPGSQDILRENGVYIVTGGLGGLGRLFAAYLARTQNAQLVLTGRSALDDTKTLLLEEVRSYGGSVEYIVSDAAEMQDAMALVAQVKAKYGRIDGVLHCAGINKDAYILKKDVADLDRVISSKIMSTLNLDYVLREEKLDFMLLFSSLTGETGNPGQADYAYANHFLNEFAVYRKQLASKGERTGRTVSVAWPLWESDGMQLSEEQRKILELQTGLVPLPVEKGILAFEYALGLDAAGPLIVGYGKQDRVRRLLEGVNRRGTAIKVVKTHVSDISEREPDDLNGSAIKEEVRTVADDSGISAAEIRSEVTEGLLEQTVRYLIGIFSELLKLEPDELDVHAEFEEYGVESVMIGYFNGKLEEDLGEVSKTLLFEYQTITTLAVHLTKQYNQALMLLFGSDMPSQQERRAESVEPVDPSAGKWYTEATPYVWQELPSFAGRFSGRAETARPTSDDAIAIIGLGGKYPLASDVYEFWDNIAAGRDCTGEIPASRWDYRKYFGGSFEKVQEGKMYSKWGAFVDDADKFDPAFFNIAPREAVIMDPQERLFAETVWSALEDAGYTKKKLQHYQEGHGANVGVFAGATTFSYQMWGPEEWERGNLSAMPNVSPWSIANRISYMFNFSGPSLAIDTACSSSLAAIHAACESLRSRECRLAIAGGVNLYLHPYKYVLMCQTKMLSPTGKCHSFGDDADGFVPGEGVGAILLKPLREAIQDNDHIYGVIRVTEVNHGGKVSGYTVPNPAAQVSLISKALKKAGVDAGTISYMEAHGTGTKLGDPIEINALNQVFDEYHPAKQSCPIGSVKSNIGHLEAAAGIASITKVLLQMKHKQLVPSIHAEKTNSNIDFGSSYFRVQRQAAPWTVEDRETPRRAGISSFGAGGTNAFVLLEEYKASGDGYRNSGPEDDGNQIIVLSAKTQYSLKQMAMRMKGFLERFPDTELSDAAYTLQTGREEMNCRMAFVAVSVQEAVDKLTVYLSSVSREDIYTGTVSKRNRPEVEKLDNDERTAALWVQGAAIDWALLYSQGMRRIIPLPTYAFERESYWIPRTESRGSTRGSHKIHPLVDGNISSFSRQQYETFLGEGSFQSFGHTAFIELFRVTSELAMEAPCRMIEDVVWGKLPLLTAECKVVTSLYESGRYIECEAGFENESGEYVVCAQGKVSTVGYRQPQAVEMDDLDDLPSLERLRDDFMAPGSYIESLRAVRTGGGRAAMGIVFKDFVESQAERVFNDLAMEELIRSLVRITSDADEIEFRSLLRCTVYGALGREVKVLASWRLLQEGKAVYEITVNDAQGNVILTMEELVVKLVSVSAEAVGVLEHSASV